MEKWSVKLLESVNEIKFGMKREDARKAMDRPFTEFKKSKFSKNTTDDFDFCHIYYNENDGVQAVEIFSDIEVLISDKKVFPNGLDNLKMLIDDLVEEDGYLTSVKYSVGIAYNEDGIESILFGCKDYYK